MYLGSVEVGHLEIISQFSKKNSRTYICSQLGKLTFWRRRAECALELSFTLHMELCKVERCCLSVLIDLQENWIWAIGSCRHRSPLGLMAFALGRRDRSCSNFATRDTLNSMLSIHTPKQKHLLNRHATFDANATPHICHLLSYHPC